MAKTKTTSTKVKNKTKFGKVRKKVSKNCTTYQCRYEDCSKNFTNANNRQVHEKLHLEESHPCSLCSYVGKTNKYLLAHKRKAHVAPTAHKCKVCGKTFHFECQLKQHNMVHTGEKPHKCHVCGKAFRVTYSLNCHMLIHTNEKPHECVFCDYSCRDSSTLRKHQNRHMGIVKAFPCKICEKKFPEKAKLKYHISEVHLDYLEIDLKKHECPVCGKMFRHKHLMNTHLQSVHERSLTCKCPICHKLVSNKHNLPAHMRTHIDLRPYVCAYEGCTAKFKDKNSLKKHTIIHYPHLHHTCKVCNKKFSRLHRLKKHMNTHDDRKKRIECDYCGVKFYTKNYLIKHIKQKHSAKRQKYVCDLCDLVTYSKPSLVMHLKYGHLYESKEKDLKCKICKDRTYKRYEYLKAHYLHTHNVRYNTVWSRRKKTTAKEPTVEVKVEPIDEEDIPLADIDLLEIEKEEIQEPTENEYLTYSKQVLSEDLAEYMLDDTATENNFDKFLRKHVFHERVKDDDEPKLEVNEKQRDLVTKKVKYLLKKTKKEEERKKMKKEAKLKRKRKRLEVEELKKVREFYNDRMKAAVAEDGKKEPAKKIKYFKTKDDSNTSKVKEENIIRYEERIVFSNEDWINEDRKDELENEEQCEDTKSGITEANDGLVICKNGDSQNDNLKDEIPSEDENSCAKTNDNDALHESCVTNDTNYLQNDTVEEENATSDKDKEDCTKTNDVSDDKTSPDDEKNDDSVNDEQSYSNDGNYAPNLRHTKGAKVNGKLNFKTHQCYICFKLFPTKEDLLKHCVTHVPTTNPADETSIKSLNHTASRKIDKKNREMKDKTIAKTRLVKTDKDWIVEKYTVRVNFEELPEFSGKELKKLAVTGNYVDRLGQLNQLAKKKGIKMMFPCDHCDKICQNFSAIKLHSRRHNPNKKPFQPRKKKGKQDDKKKKQINYKHRLAKPKPIVNKHKCDEELKTFYKTHIRGADIEFWQFLKIFNKMDREHIQNFKDFEGRTDFGIHNNDEINCDIEIQPQSDNVEENVTEYQPTLKNETEYETTRKNVSECEPTRKLVQNRKTSNGAKPAYSRVIMISKKQHLERQAAIKKLREKVAKN